MILVYESLMIKISTVAKLVKIHYMFQDKDCICQDSTELEAITFGFGFGQTNQVTRHGAIKLIA